MQGTGRPDAGAEYFIPPDTEIGIPLPPGKGEMLLDGFVYVWIYQPSGPADNSGPLLCPRFKGPDNNQKALIRAGAYPGWGEYHWGWYGHPMVPEGPDERADQEFSANQLGDYTATVYYEVPFEGWDVDGSDFIHVFDADLSLEGTPEESEDSPGALLGKGSGRTRLALNISPTDPDDMMPSGFHDGQPHRDRAPYTVTLSAGPAVQIYAEQTGGEPLTGEALEWGWKFDLGTYSYIEQDPPYPSELWVEPVAGGIGDLEVRLEYRTVNEVLGWDPNWGWAGPGNPDANVATDRIKVSVIAVQVWVNGTSDYPDDYVVMKKPEGVRADPYNGPAGRSDNGIPLKLNLLAPGGTTCHLKLASIGGGTVEFKHQDLTPFVDGEPIAVDQPLNLLLYGTAASSALNDAKIEARTVETGDDVCGYEYVTVVWFNEEDLHFRGSDHQGEGLTPNSTAKFSNDVE